GHPENPGGVPVVRSGARPRERAVRGGRRRAGAAEGWGRVEPRGVADVDARRPGRHVPRAAGARDPGARGGSHRVDRRLLLRPGRQRPRGVLRTAAERVEAGAPVLGGRPEGPVPRALGRGPAPARAGCGLALPVPLPVVAERGGAWAQQVAYAAAVALELRAIGLARRGGEGQRL